MKEIRDIPAPSPWECSVQCGPCGITFTAEEEDLHGSEWSGYDSLDGRFFSETWYVHCPRCGMQISFLTKLFADEYDPGGMRVVVQPEVRSRVKASSRWASR